MISRLVSFIIFFIFPLYFSSYSILLLRVLFRDLVITESIEFFMMVVLRVFVSVMLFIFVFRYNNDFMNQFPIDNIRKKLLSSLFYFILLITVCYSIFILISFFRLSILDNNSYFKNSAIVQLNHLINDKNYLIFSVLIIYFVVIIPLIEELSFRYFLLNSYDKSSLFNTLNLIVTAIVFSLFHLPGRINVIMSFISGLMLGYLKIKDGNLIRPVIVHAFTNLSVLVFILLKDRY